MDEKLHVSARVRKISLLMKGRSYVHVLSFSQNEEICSIKECKSHLKSLLTNFHMKMVIQIYTQVLIEKQHCDVTSLLYYNMRSGQKSMNVNLTKCQEIIVNLTKCQEIIAGSYFVLYEPAHCYVSKGYRAYTCRMGKKLQNAGVYLLNYTASSTIRQ
jgi:hypothetical protein